MKRLGTVLVFKPGATKEEVAKALEALKPILDADYYWPRIAGPAQLIHEFEDEHGGPVWYVP